MQEASSEHDTVTSKMGSPDFETIRRADIGKFRVLKVHHCEYVPYEYTKLGEDKHSLEDAQDFLREYEAGKPVSECCFVGIYNDAGKIVWASFHEPRARSSGQKN